MAMNRNKIRMNSRGLPKGIGLHQLRAARKLKARVARLQSAEGSGIGLVRVELAERTLDRVHKVAMARHIERCRNNACRHMAHGTPVVKQTGGTSVATATLS